MPLSVTVRAFPIGRTTPVQPYVGGGVNFYRWQYSETGEFIDFSDDSLPIFDETFTDDGTAVGATILGGVRVPIGRTYRRRRGPLAGRHRRPRSGAQLRRRQARPRRRHAAATFHVRF